MFVAMFPRSCFHVAKNNNFELVFNAKRYDPYIFNFNLVTHQYRQRVDQRPSVVASASHGKPPRMRWTDELHARFVAVVNGLGGPRAATPMAIMKHMEHMGISRQQIRAHLQAYRQKLATGYPSK